MLHFVSRSKSLSKLLVKIVKSMLFVESLIMLFRADTEPLVTLPKYCCTPSSGSMMMLLIASMKQTENWMLHVPHTEFYVTPISSYNGFTLSLMIGLLLISRMINQFKFISSSRLSRWTKKTGITG